MAPCGYMDTKSKGNTQGTDSDGGWLARWFGGVQAEPSEDASEMNLAEYMERREAAIAEQQSGTAPTPVPVLPPTAAETPLVVGKHFFAEYRPLAGEDEPWTIYGLGDTLQPFVDYSDVFHVSSESNARQLIEALDRTFEAGRTPEQTWTTINRSAVPGEVLPDGANA